MTEQAPAQQALAPKTKPINHNLNRSTKYKKRLFLTKGKTVLIFIYYFTLLAASFIASCMIFFDNFISELKNYQVSIIGSCSIACMGCSIYYIRKLYKSVLNESLETYPTDNDLKAIATLVYFAARPFFSMSFALLVTIGLKSGLLISASASADVGDGFIQMAMFISFFVGFLTGKFLGKLEKWGDGIIGKLTGEQSENG